MVISAVQLIAIFIVPAVIMKTRNGKLTRLFGTIGMAYFYGLLVAFSVWAANLLGADFTLNADIGGVGSYAAIGVAIPLLLFSSNLGEVKKLTKTVLLSFGSLVVSVIVVALAANYIFGRTFDFGRELSAMSVGLYTGGTPNFNAIGVIIGVRNDVIALGNLCDMIIGGVFYVFILLLAKPLLSKILKSPSSGLYLKGGSATNVDVLYDVHLSRGLIRNILLALLCVAAGALVGALLWMLNGSVKGSMTDYIVPGIMITVTVLGMAFSFLKKVREVRENTTVGQYLILVFSFSLASSLNIASLGEGFIYTFFLLAGITICSFIIHVLISKLLGIDADCTIVTMTAGIYGPAFIPAVTSQLKNESLTAPGLICGALGYAVGTFLGVAVWYIL